MNLHMNSTHKLKDNKYESTRFNVFENLCSDVS